MKPMKQTTRWIEGELERVRARANEMEVALLSSLRQVDAGCTQSAGEIIRASLKRLGIEETDES